MKITDPDVIKNGEKELIDAVSEDLDLDAVKEILKNQIAQTVLSATGGRIVVHNNEIAFSIDFDLNLSGSLMFDRDGNHIPLPDGAEPAGPDAGEDSEEDLSGDIDLDDVTIDEVMGDLNPEPGDAEAADSDLDPALEMDESADLDALEDPLELDLDDETMDNDESDVLDLPDPDSGEEDLESTSMENSSIDPSDLTDQDLEDLLDDDLLEDGLNESQPDESQLDLPGDEPEPDTADDLDQTDILEADEDTEADPSESDMDDILQENRDFWEQKED